jgi:hypothetical protein
MHEELLLGLCLGHTHVMGLLHVATETAIIKPSNKHSTTKSLPPAPPAANADHPFTLLWLLQCTLPFW